MVVYMMAPWLALMLPQLIAGLGKLISSNSAIDKQNRYNSPFESMQRIRAAGLPYAAFEGGQAGSQSSLPDLSGWDNIGSSVGTSINQSNQMKSFEQLLRKMMADADVSENLRDVSNEETIGQLGYTYTDPNGNSVPIARVGKLLDFQLKEYGAWMAKHNEKMLKIDKLIKEARYDSGQLMNAADEEFNKLVNTNKLMEQVWI